MENFEKRLTEDINNYDIAMIIEEEESVENHNDFTLAEIVNCDPELNSTNENNNLISSLFNPSKLNFTKENKENNQNIQNNSNKNLNSNANYLANMAQTNSSINLFAKADLSEELQEKQTDNIDISYNENDLNEIYDSKQAKNKILCCEMLNFIEVFIHSVLYLRKVYPQEAFQNYNIYNLNLKFITEPEINEYISEFLDTIENMLFNNLIKRITINIIEPETQRILEYFSLNIEVNEYYNDLVYADICLHLKSLLYKFQMDFANKKELHPELNKSFNLSIETINSKIFTGSSLKTFKELSDSTEDHFVIELFSDMPIKLLANKEVCCVLDHVNFQISISRNYV